MAAVGRGLDPGVGNGYPAIPPLPPDSRRHPLLEKGTFEQLHRNDILETRPNIVHFAGFQIHKEHTHVLRVLNISPSSLRLSIIGPSTPWFRISYDKKGLLAPGMSEEITVVFSPHEWRYYYDTVKIFCGGLSENLVVPIHGYPSAADIALPRIVDFGSVAIGTSRTKVVPLSCKIPIKFEFEIKVLEAHPDFEVTPLFGSIPPDGTTNVAITFLPTKHRTSRTELQFNVSQFDFDPVTVSVVGSCLPELSRTEVLESAASEVAAAAEKALHDEMVSKVQTLKSKRNRKEIQVKHPAISMEPPEKMVDGVKVLTRVDQQATNFVLNQTAGKLPLKDLFTFIRDQREAAEKRRRKAEASRGGAEDGAVAEDMEGDSDDRQALELRFEMRYREVEKYDKDKELKGLVAIGQEPPTEDEVTQVTHGREQRHDRLMGSRVEEDTKRVESVLRKDRVAVPISYKSSVPPHWDENANDTFSMRLQVIDRFVRAGSKCLARVRAQKNSDRLHEAMRTANVTDKASCRVWVDAENKAAAVGGRGAQRGGKSSGGAADKTSRSRFKSNFNSQAAEEEDDMTLGVVTIPLDFVLPLQIPTSQSSLSTEEAKTVEVQPLGNFKEFSPAELNPRLDYKVLQYEPHPVPPPAAYMRPHDNRVRLSAALEELSIRGQRGDIFDGAEEPLTMPDSCLLPPEHDPMSLLVPSTECRTFIGFPEFTESDFEYRLQQPPPPVEPLQLEPLLPADIASLDTPWLGVWRRTRRLQDPFAHFDPLPGCFAEAGGSLGPRLGSDAAGEQLSFLPVGGHSRDIPSDTDSDEREDFQLEPPGDEEYEQALKGMSGPLDCEAWRKRRGAEERLRAQFASNNTAVRERLRELNKDLDHRNKLYLG